MSFGEGGEKTVCGLDRFDGNVYRQCVVFAMLVVLGFFFSRQELRAKKKKNELLGRLPVHFR